jgi:hypothetical protein
MLCCRIIDKLNNTTSVLGWARWELKPELEINVLGGPRSPVGSPPVNAIRGIISPRYKHDATLVARSTHNAEPSLAGLSW